MPGWRNNVAIIKDLVTGGSQPVQRTAWRRDFLTIAETVTGNTPGSWREAVRMWAVTYGVISHSWRFGLAGIAIALGADKYLPWREALRYIAEHYNGATVFVAWDDSVLWNDADIWSERGTA